MPIGRLARLSRLSVKLLRRYADDGLLVPAWIDPQSGYRYYRTEQVRSAATIALLRSLGVPLATVREILSAHDEDALARLVRHLEPGVGLVCGVIAGVGARGVGAQLDALALNTFYTRGMHLALLAGRTATPARPS